MAIQDTDKLLVNRSGTNYTTEAQNLMAIQDTDSLLVVRGTSNYKATGADLKAYAEPSPTNPFVAQPTIISPTASSTVYFVNPILQSSNFAGVYTTSHYSSSWQIQISGGDWSSPIVNSVDNTNNLLYFTSPIELTPLQSYDCRVKFRADNISGVESDWSDSVNFTIAGIATNLLFGTTQYWAISAASDYPTPVIATPIFGEYPIANKIANQNSAISIYGTQAPNVNGYIDFPGISTDFPAQLAQLTDAAGLYYKSDTRVYISLANTTELAGGSNNANVLRRDGCLANSVGIVSDTSSNNPPVDNIKISYHQPLSATCFMVVDDATQSDQYIRFNAAYGQSGPSPVFYAGPRTWMSQTVQVNPYQDLGSSGSFPWNNFPYWKIPANQTIQMPAGIRMKQWIPVNIGDTNPNYENTKGINCLLILGDDNKLYLTGSQNYNTNIFQFPAGFNANTLTPYNPVVDPSGITFTKIAMSAPMYGPTSVPVNYWGAVSGLTSTGKIYLTCGNASAWDNLKKPWAPVTWPSGSDLPPNDTWLTPLFSGNDSASYFAIGSDRYVYYITPRLNQFGVAGRMTRVTNPFTEQPLEVLSDPPQSWYDYCAGYNQETGTPNNAVTWIPVSTSLEST